VFFVALGCLTGSSASAARLPTLRLSFHRVGVASGVAFNSRRVYAGATAAGAPGVLFDDQTGTRAEVDQHGCVLAVGTISQATIAFQCLSIVPAIAPAIYSVATNTWSSIALNPQVTQPCGAGSCVSVTGAGSRWLAPQQSDCDGVDDHCSFPTSSRTSSPAR
jgi:hypothetical protein